VLRWLWAVFVFSVYSAAIAWLLISKILEKVIKKKYSFNIDIIVFVCLFTVAVAIYIILLS
jgi:hypothetical protein